MAAAAELSVSVRERDVSSSGVAWGAVLGGGAAAAALSLLMLALGAGFGLSTVSPWSNVGLSASGAGSLAVAWLVLTEVVAFSMGGYLTGRLRTKWHVLHDDEVHFRDTANGFLSWSVAVVMTVAFLGAAAASMAGIAAPAEVPARSESSYFVDRLFRSDRVSENDAAMRAEAGRIFAKILLHEDGAAADVSYLSQLVAVRTGLNASDAGKRVSDTIADTRRAEDAARKATAHLLLWIFLSLMIGAFCASYAATIGGRQRDDVRVL
jgi:hypothetical protein